MGAQTPRRPDQNDRNPQLAMPTSAHAATPAPAVPAGDPAAVLWDGHFIDPARALERVHGVLAAPEEHDERTLAWAELTQGFHHLFFTGGPAASREWLDRAGARFIVLGDRRGALLVDTGRARMLIFDQQPLAAREMLQAMYADAQRELEPRDFFWVINALCATYYYTDQIDEAIRYMYETLELLRTIEMSPQLVAVLSNLAAALVTVADYAPARELAQEAVTLLANYSNPQLLLYARSNLAEAQLGTGDRDGALATVDAMFGERDMSRVSPQNHYCGIAAEVYALHGRIDDAEDAAALAAQIYETSGGGFNEVHLRWAQACVACAGGDDVRAVQALELAADAAARHKHVMTLCKANGALSERLAKLRRFEEAFRAQRRLFDANNQRLDNRASARYYLLRVEHELSSVRAERDRALRQRQESETLNRQLEQLNTELSQKMREIEELQGRLKREAVHDPLTQLFNRRYLDSAMPGLIGSAERWSTPLTLALVDLDHFKRVNDRHGHLAGDKVLRRIGKMFGTSLRPSDIVSRWGGEEFCIVFPETDVAGAATALASLAAKLRTLEVQWGNEVIGGFTFSAALAAHGPHGRTLDELVDSADRALYAAKGAGRDRVFVAQA
jgi:two-component system cell cycle response regulator